MSDDWKLPPDALGDWPAEAPPEGFADRVMARRAIERDRAALAARDVASLPGLPPPPRRRRGALAVFAAVGVAAIVALFVVTRPTRAPARLAGGVESADERRSLDVGGRAVAVAEVGASLDWRVAADGSARVRQGQGNVFYRVEKGRAFVVETPAGDVVVLGTCFRVEVDPMNPKVQTAVAAGAGALVAAAVLVTVYEGKVRVSNAHGQVDVRPGEQALAHVGEAPSRLPAADAPVKVAVVGPGGAELLDPPPEGATREQLLARDARQREQLAMLGARVHKLEAAAGEAGAGKRGGRPGDRGPLGDKMFGFTPDEYAAMAEECEIRYDLPPFDLEPRLVSARQAEHLGLSEEERGQVNALLERENDRYLKDLRALYVEATGDTTGVESLQPMAMGMEIQHKSSDRESAQARRRLDLEKAGKVAPPADPARMPVIDRYFRLVTGAGDRVESELGKIIGPERARTAREDGLMSNRSIQNGCDEEDESGEGGGGR